MLGKQEYFCHQGRDYNKGKKDKYIEKRNVVLKQDHVFIKSREHTQPTKNTGLSSEILREKNLPLYILQGWY